MGPTVLPCMFEINITKTLSVERGPAKEKRNHHCNWNISLLIINVINWLWLNLLCKMSIHMMVRSLTKILYKIMYSRSLTSFLNSDFYPFFWIYARRKVCFYKGHWPQLQKRFLIRSGDKKWWRTNNYVTRFLAPA